MSNHSAIVIGGSMSGLLAARVLTDFFERVTIIERDQFPDAPENRGGVPQARHLHVLLTRGHDIMESLFPGLDAELEAAGVPRVEWGYDTTGFTRGGWLPRFHGGIFTRSVSRTMLEWTVRRRLQNISCIQIMEGWQVSGLLTSDDKSRVTGVMAQARGGSREERTLNADLVVDASGRNSHTPEWLQTLGYGAVDETVVNSFLGYSTRWFKKSPTFSEFWKDILILGIPPVGTRGAALWEVEGNRWVVTLAGANRDYPPTDEAGYMEFLRSLPTTVLYDVVKDAEPISDIYGYQRTENRWRHYERLPRWPEGFAVTGDAACGFNPVYGQGMTAGAIEAQALQACLREGMDGAGARFQKRLAKDIQAIWVMATGEDLRYPATEGDRPGAFTRLVQKYFDRVQLILPNDTDMARTFLEITNLITPPTALFKPAYVWKVLTRRPEVTA